MFNIFFKLLTCANVELSEDEIVNVTYKKKELDENIVQDAIMITLRQVMTFMTKKKNV